MDKFLGSSKRLYTSGRGGYITLISVLVVGAVATAIAVSLLLLGLSASRTSFTGEESVQARGLADACAEEALAHIRDAQACAGSVSEAFGGGTCTGTVSGTGTACTVSATGTVGQVVRKTKVLLNAVDPAIAVLSWREVADF